MKTPLNARLSFLNSASFRPIANTPFLSKPYDNFLQSPSPYMLVPPIPREKIPSPKDFSNENYERIRRSVHEHLNFQNKYDIAFKFNNIEIPALMISNFENNDDIEENLFDFFVNYLMRLQIMEDKFLYFLEVVKNLNEPTTALIKRNLIPKRHLYNYLIFLINFFGKWFIIIYDNSAETLEVFPFFMLSNKSLREETSNIISNILNRYNIIVKKEISFNENMSYSSFLKTHSPLLLILTFMLDIYKEGRINNNTDLISLQKIIESKRLMEFVLYSMIYYQNDLANKLSRKSIMKKNSYYPKAKELTPIPAYKKKKKPELTLNIPKKNSTKKNIENTDYLVSQKSALSTHYLKSGYMLNTAKNKIQTPKSALKIPNKTPQLKKNINQSEQLPSERVKISKNELKLILNDLKNEVYEEVKKKNFIESFIAKELKKNIQDDNENNLKISKDELKKLLKNFKKEINENIEVDKKNKQNEYFMKQQSMGYFNNLLTYYYYYNPEMYEKLSQEYSKRLGEKYLESMFQ